MRARSSLRVMSHRSSGGYSIFGGSRRVFAAGTGPGGRLRLLGAQEVNWAYFVSGVVAVMLLVYLVAALIRAEDL